MRPAPPPVAPPLGAPPGVLRIEGAAEHNLKYIDVDIPLNRLVCVTGVSGSGKSTLVHDVLYPALERAKGKPTENPGRHRALHGASLIGDVVMVDQSRIGRTTRSNPASYVGAFDAIRALFAKLPQARERKYTAGTFSFNAGNGRCPGCGGNGFEHVEMQFLSDVYLRCPDCDGKRYRAEILECKLARGGAAPLSIADVLELTVSEALAAFHADTEVCLRLAPLAEVGLDYLRLGQPVPTPLLRRRGAAVEARGPSGRQRGARARLASARRPTHGSLFLFDEPTTGLHFDDVAKAAARLPPADRGRALAAWSSSTTWTSMRAADWIIDLGPEGGDAGGALVAAGTPEEIMRVASSHTGRALRETHRRRRSMPTRPSPRCATPGSMRYRHCAIRAARSHPQSISIRGAREHNLKHIDVDRRRNHFTVITGVSGSGKSTLAFDICSPRDSGAISNRSMPMPGSSSSPPRGPTSMRSSASRRRSRSSSAPAAAGARARSRHSPRSTTFCGCCT